MKRALLCLAFALSAFTIVVNQPPSIDNVATFARLYGYVRFFHPGDAAADLEWDRFAVHGVRQVRDAATPDELLETLERLFSPIAPTVQIYATSDGPPPVAPEVAPDDTSGLRVVAWQHKGVAFGSSNIYASRRLNRKSPSSEAQSPFGVLMQHVDATPYQGRKIRLTAEGRSEVDGAGNQLQFWVRVDRPNRQMGFFDNMGNRPIVSPEWATYQITGDVADDAHGLAFGAFLMGSGQVWLDDFTLETSTEDGVWEPIPISNPAFEEGEAGILPNGWNSNGPGYRFLTTREGDALIESVPPEMAVREPLFSTYPVPGDVIQRPIGSGLSVQLPLALYSRDGATLDGGHPTDLSSLVDLAALGASDVDLRLAVVVVAWNALQHFYPYFDVVDADWEDVLHEALADAMDDADADEFERTLQRMLAALEDGHAGVQHAGMRDRAMLPFQAELIENEIVVVATADSSLFEIGDVIRSIDGVAARDVLVEGMKYQSGSDQWRRFRALYELTMGKAGTTADVKLERGGRQRQLQAERSFEGNLTEAKPENVTEIEPGIFYVNLDQAQMSEINARIHDLAAADGVIFDMRGYPNGTHSVLQYLTDQPLRSARWQVPQIIYPDRTNIAGYDTTGRWTLPPLKPRFQGKSVFLTNGRAISYAESVMGIVEQYELGEIVGEPTAGANGNVNVIPLPGGYSIRFTGMRVLKHDGSQHHLVGIQPTIPLERTIAGVRDGRDEYIEKAVEVIRSND